MRRTADAGFWLLCAVLLFMWAMSHRLSSIGVEFERRAGDQVENRWCGIVYPGTGSVMVGSEVTFEPFHGQQIDSFDLAGAFLDAPFPNRATTWWEHRGFIWEMGPGRHWVGIPAWLAAVAGCALLVVRILRRRRATSPQPPCRPRSA